MDARRLRNIDLGDPKTFLTGNETEQLLVALNFYKINAEKFARIHTRELKLEHLRYLRFRKEFECFTLIKKHKLRPDLIDSFLILADKAHKIIEASHFITQHQSKYTRHSVGLNEIDVRSLYEEINEDDENDEQLYRSVYEIAKKEQGVEPGFEAIKTKDVVLHVANRFPEQKERLAFIERFGADIPTIYNLYQSELPKYLIKLTYDNISSNNKIAPNREDLQHSNTVQKIYKKNKLLGKIVTEVYREVKTCTATEKNIEAVLEAIGNDVARACGIEVQKQFLYLGEYPNGTLKFMLKAEWVKDASTLKPLAGDHKNYNNYCVKPVLYPMDKILYLSDNSIKNLPEHLLLLAPQKDPDAIGSKGQNKLRVGNKFVGIDFGHAYSKGKSLVDKLQIDFSFNDPDYKNYSIFYDAQRSQFVRGVLKMARLSGKELDPAILASYGAEFVKEIEQMEVGADEKVFDDYILKLTEMQDNIGDNDTFSRENKVCLEEIIKHVKEVKATAINEREKLVAKFSPYLSMTQQTVDFIENLEKLFAGRENTSLRSNDGTVMLHHLRIKQNNLLGSLINLTNKSFSFRYKDASSARRAAELLTNWVAENEIDPNLVQSDISGSQLTITFNTQCLNAEIFSLFSEDKIKRAYHKQDYTHYQHYLREQELQQLTAIFGKNEVYLTFQCNLDCNKYEVSIHPLVGTELSPHFVSVLKKNFPDVQEISGTYVITFPPADTDLVTKLLSALPIEVKRADQHQKNIEGIKLEIKLQYGLLQETIGIITEEKSFKLTLANQEFLKWTKSWSYSQTVPGLTTFQPSSASKHSEFNGKELTRENIEQLKKLLETSKSAIIESKLEADFYFLDYAIKICKELLDLFKQLPEEVRIVELNNSPRPSP